MRWTRDDVITAAFTILEQEGLEGLSLRAVARGLGAHLNSVTWYVKSKQSLVDLMADAIVGSVSLEDLSEEPIARVRLMAHRYRGALLARRDGGRLVAGTFTGGGQTLRVAEVIVGGLLDAGFGEAEAARLCWAIVYLALGLTQEEQTSPADSAPGLAEALDSGGFPALAKVGVPLLAHDSFDSRFAYGIDRLLHLA
ncbi:TetR/AcrR family transcriptional regulator C-terminal domain-containing protein [Amycolatopsis saalfeldensis]|uniref:Regulatory protein, tetR family n=1 Tax=Amycolatopsis saalfeldensis TaxID=394193 RepID=A0A1H8REF8_9PSEU|nr:TetR/AcrR family transcriptional regulator C-terminal domain-containing protein [Amycolatopsis saalfeldensis]SEO64647.1 regulatory protein, tetR family [Amycolatopsis saalfeldensis]